MLGYFDLFGMQPQTLLESTSIKKEYLFSFLVFEDELRLLKAAAERQISSLYPHAEVTFSALARFDDLSSKVYDDFSAFIENCATEREPEAVEFKWSTFSIGEAGQPIAAEIVTNFITEKRIKNGLTIPGTIYPARISLTTTGTSDTWVNASFHALEPFLIRNTRIPKYMRWMEIFRNPILVSLLQNMGPMLSFPVSLFFVQAIFDQKQAMMKQATLRKILGIA